jgi:cation diffusion facilitator CzcD-associated flavoprotein CzcO
VTECPWASFDPEGRERVGGTWDLFVPRHPFRTPTCTRSRTRGGLEPDEASAPGRHRDYIEDTAHEDGTFDTIRFGHRVARLDWSSDDHRWSVSAERTLESGEVEPVELTCSFVMSCTGYYRYDRGYLPEWEEWTATAARSSTPVLAGD